jgi:hypothetical protein
MSIAAYSNEADTGTGINRKKIDSHDLDHQSDRDRDRDRGVMHPHDFEIEMEHTVPFDELATYRREKNERRSQYDHPSRVSSRRHHHERANTIPIRKRFEGDLGMFDVNV